MKARTPTPLFDQAHIAPLRVLTPTPLQSPSKDGRLSTPYAGEGGSGGALALGVGNRILMMENAVYSVISPESCAAIIYRDSGKAPQAAAALRLTAPDLLELRLIDAIVPEPKGGAHTDHEAAAALLDAALLKHFNELTKTSAAELIASRYNKFRNMAQFLRVE